MEYHGIRVSDAEMAAFCQCHHIAKLSLFGSVLGEEFGPDSDVDVLIEFEPGKVPGLIRMAGMEIELSEMLGRQVDLRTLAELSKYFRDRVLREAELQYAAVRRAT